MLRMDNYVRLSVTSVGTAVKNGSYCFAGFRMTVGKCIILVYYKAQ